MRKVKIVVSGRVQGVGFRYMTKMKADELGIFGSVRNLEDGSVEVIAFGDDKTMDTFIRAVKDSPSPSGRVDSFQIEEAGEINMAQKFRITH